MLPVRGIAPIFQKGYKPLPSSSTTTKTTSTGKDKKKKNGGVVVDEPPQEGIYVGRDGQPYFKRADGTKEPRNW